LFLNFTFFSSKKASLNNLDSRKKFPITWIPKGSFLLDDLRNFMNFLFFSGELAKASSARIIKDGF